MSQDTQHHRANARRVKFAALLREMFQLDQPELDFGLYRIMHARKADIDRFIEQDLPQIAQDAFKDFAGNDKAQLDKDLEQARQGAVAAGIAPEDSPKVQELEAQYATGFNVAREEGEVYDALVTFFSRYYSEGDFISQRRYGDGTYAIPYDGEEVKLHWANKDQYYIKSSDTLRDYSFRLNLDAGPADDPLRVHFKLVDAAPGAQDNNKEADDSKRVFVLDADAPFTVEQGEPNTAGHRFNELHCRFHFRPATMDDWTAPVKQNATTAAAKKAPTQDHLRAIAEERLLGKTSTLPPEWRSALAKRYRKADGELAEYSTFRGQLNNYSKKNTFDYFIHKDLGGFLTRELDFYLKHELMNWEDLSAAKNDPARLAPLLSKLDVVRTLGEKIIAFLSQLENFQKKLWLKKKFVTETNYCITLDRLEDSPELLAQVFANSAQKQDWKKLYQLDLDALEQALTGTDAVELIERPEYRYLMLDTAHFNAAFKAQLLDTLDNLDDQCDGLLIHSENFQALNLLQERYREQVKCVYIDPPYNTGSDGFLYKDTLQHSSWGSFILDRSLACNPLFDIHQGALFASIDDDEQDFLRKILSISMGNKNFVANIIWQKKYAPANDATWLSDDHDFVVNFAASKQSWIPGRIPRSASNNSAYTNPDNDKRGSWRADNYKCNKTANERPNLYYAITNPNTGEEIWPKENAVWRYTSDAHAKNEADNRVWWGKSGTNKTPAYKRFLSDVSDLVPRTLWSHNEVGHNQDGIRDLRALIPGTSMTNPKPSGLVERVIRVGNGSLTLDYFAGSGTTGHAVINLNREDDGQRKYILVEMGKHFDTVLKPRMQKVVYSQDWKDGAPTAPDTGVSHCFKYLRLESYEDTLGNLELERKPGMASLFDNAENDAARQAYVMQYLLDVETSGSPSLLNIQRFLEPTRYELKVRSAGGDETVPVNVDLLETFNYLLGLTVEHIAAPIHFDADITHGKEGRLQAQVKRAENGRWWFRTVYGTNRNGQQVLVVWRNLPSVIAGEDNGLNRDNAVLDAVLVEKLKIRLTESADDEIDILYVNGDHNIHIPRDRKGQPMDQARIELVEEAFQRLMFADTQ